MSSIGALAMPTLDEHLYYWISIANQRRDRYGFPPGVIEELVYSLKTGLGKAWLQSAILGDARPVDAFGLTGQPLRRWMLSAFIDGHVIQTLELSAYLREFAADPCLHGKVLKLQRDSFWPVFLELAMAYRMRRASKPDGIVSLSCETSAAVGDFTIQLGSTQIACECSRLGFSPAIEEQYYLLQETYTYIENKVKNLTGACCIKVEIKEPLTGHVYSRLLVRLKKALNRFKSGAQTSADSDASIAVTVEPLTETSEEIPFRLVDDCVVDVKGSSWTCAFSIASVPARDEKEIAEKVRSGEPIASTERARILVRFPPNPRAPDAYERLEDRIRRKIAQTALPDGVIGRIVLVEWPVNPREAEIATLNQSVLESLQTSRRTLAVIICTREANPHYRYHYSIYVVDNRSAVTAIPGLDLVLKRFVKYDTISDPILNEKYLRSWKAATEKVAWERREKQASAQTISG